MSSGGWAIESLAMSGAPDSPAPDAAETPDARPDGGREELSAVLVVKDEAAQIREAIERGVDVVETDGADTAAIEASLRDILKLRGSVEMVASGSLPNDGKVIDDTRDLT